MAWWHLNITGNYLLEGECINGRLFSKDGLTKAGTVKSLLGVCIFTMPEWVQCEDSEVAVMVGIGMVSFCISAVLLRRMVGWVPVSTTRLLLC